MQARGTGRRWTPKARKAVMLSMAFDVYACLVRQAGVPGSQESGKTRNFVSRRETATVGISLREMHGQPPNQ
jgi:hypothetical protein